MCVGRPGNPTGFHGGDITRAQGWTVHQTQSTCNILGHRSSFGLLREFNYGKRSYSASYI